MNSGHIEHSSDDSIRAEPHSHVNVNRFTLPQGARDILIATVMAAAIITIIIISFLLHDAYKDLQTQVWVKQDKEEEKFQKFVAGPYAQLAGELRANEILFAQCKEPKK